MLPTYNPCFSGLTKPRVKKQKQERGGVVRIAIEQYPSTCGAVQPIWDFGNIFEAPFSNRPPTFENFWGYFTYICGPSSYSSHVVFFISPVACGGAVDACHHWRCLHMWAQGHQSPHCGHRYLSTGPELPRLTLTLLSYTRCCTEELGRIFFPSVGITQ